MSEDKKPIIAAIEQVLALFGIDNKSNSVKVLLPHDTYVEINECFSASKVIYFETLGNSIKNDKWLYDSYRFWCGYFKRLGFGYNGDNICDLVSNNEPNVQWLQKLCDKIKHKSGNSKTLAHLINDKKYSFSRIAHEQRGEKSDIFELAYLITALKESVLWEYKPDVASGRLIRILIVDDRLYDFYTADKDNKNKIGPDINKLLSGCKGLPIEFYSLIKSNDVKFEQAIELLQGSVNDESVDIGHICCKITQEILEMPKAPFKEHPHNLNPCTSLSFDYILVDLWCKHTDSIRGLGLISSLHHALQERIRKHPLTFIKRPPDAVSSRTPEIIAYSIADDPETIQMANRMGASGYATKSRPESVILAMVRAGFPLSLEDATRFDWLCSNSFPIISRLPRQISKHLMMKEVSDNTASEETDLVWLRRIPKADLHVHFGTAIPIQWCYILSLISLMHWQNYWEKCGRGADYCAVVELLVNDLKIILDGLPTKNFRREFIRKFAATVNTSEIVSIKDAISFLVNYYNSHKKFKNLLDEKQIACIINVCLGGLVLSVDGWNELYENAAKRIDELKSISAKKTSVHLHNLSIYRDCSHLVGIINLPAEMPQKMRTLLELIPADPVSYPDTFDPLSELLSIEAATHPYGLERYLASSALVGGSLMQFTDTLLLAAMSIPEWAAAKRKKNSEDRNVYDNTIRLELRTTPQGFLMPHGRAPHDNTLAAKLICVGLEYGIKCLLQDSAGVSTHLLLSIKRDRKRESIGELIRIAVDMKEDYERYLAQEGIGDVEGHLIPHVAGLDVAGIERNNLPAELHPYYQEAFERCLLSTIHAGETESAKSVREAIFMLNATRIGHGLSMEKDIELKSMISKRRISVELCPRSNQFTNGFAVRPGEKATNAYVYNEFRGNLLTCINTDNPTISHRSLTGRDFAYPLSEEFIMLGSMIKLDEKVPLNRLEILYLVFSGFISMFGPEQAKKYIIGIADDEVLAVLADEYLDVDLKGYNA